MARAPPQLWNTASMAPRSCTDRVLRERLAGGLLDELLVLLAEAAERVGRHLGVVGDAVLLLGRVEQPVEVVALEVEDDAAVHRDEAPVGVVGEPGVAGLGGEALHRLVVEPEVEDRVHHPGHRELGAGAHAHEQRVGRVAELLAHRLLDLADGLGHLAVERRRPAAVEVGAARIGGDGEPGRHRQPEHRGHLGEVGALAAEEVLLLHRGLAVLVIEAEDEGHEGRAYSARRSLPISPSRR